MAICVVLECNFKYSYSRIIDHGLCRKKYGDINHMPSLMTYGQLYSAGQKFIQTPQFFLIHSSSIGIDPYCLMID